MYRYSKKYHSLPFTDELVAIKETRNRCDILKSTANLTRYLDIKNDTSFHEEFTKWLKKKEIRWSIRNNRNNYFIANQISLKDILGRIGISHVSIEYLDCLYWYLALELRNL